MIMSLKSIYLTYNVSERTAMSGIIDSPGLFGQNNVTNSPGWDFVFGSQDASTVSYTHLTLPTILLV